MIKSPEWRSERTVALFLFGATAISPPFLAIFALDSFVFGVPLLHAYLFAIWVVLIVLLAILSETSKYAESADETPEPPSREG